MQTAIKVADTELAVEYVPVSSLRPAEYNPRVWSKEATEQLTESIKRFGIVDPLLVNSNPKRRGVVIGGNFRTAIFKKLGIKTCPVVWVDIADLKKEKELCVRLNKNTGEFDWTALADFGEDFLDDIGFSSEEVDEIFDTDDMPEEFDLAKELKKLKIDQVKVQKGDIYRLGEHLVMCGDSTVESDMLKLMGNEKADLCLTDPPYILDYLHGKKRNGKATEGFGLKRDRKYLETDSLPENFSDLWMANVAKIQKPDFSIIVYENPKNLRTIWNALEKRWKYRNTIVWHLPNRVQGFSAKYKFYNKYDIALVGTSGKVALNLIPEDEPLLEEEYGTALYATSGKPHWEGPGKGKKYCPTDFIEFVAADEKSSGQGIIFGTKPIEILIPYLKVLTKRGAIVVEPFGGSGSTLIAAEKMRRTCRLMEKSPVYTEVIMRRWENLTGRKAEKV
jgi:DNA modification methylase